jgi:hypothetical protein
MRSSFSEKGRTRVYVETYFSYFADVNQRRKPLREKRPFMDGN